MKAPIKLRQAQIWQRGGEFLRIVRLERLEVEYKTSTSLDAKKGTHHKVSKKEFCRLLKGATLVAPQQVRLPSACQKSEKVDSHPPELGVVQPDPG